MCPMSDSTQLGNKNKSITLRPEDQARIAALRASTGIDNDVDVIRFALAETCRIRGCDPTSDPIAGGGSAS